MHRILWIWLYVYGFFLQISFLYTAFWNNLGSFFAYSVDFFCILLYHSEQIVVEGLDCAL